jgi:galactokinase
VPSPRTRAELGFGARYEGKPSGVAWAPGRLNLLGEHVDHQGGDVLPMALPQGVAVAWAPRPDRSVRVTALDVNAGDRFTFGQIARSGRRYADLLRGACASLEAEGIHVPGLDLAIASDLPMGAGLGSSAAYLVAVLNAFLAAAERVATPADHARWVMKAEREWGGVPCGPMDPYVSALGLVGAPIRLRCKTLEHEVLPWPEGVEAVPEDTGVRRSLDETPYAGRRAALERALRAPSRTVASREVEAFERTYRLAAEAPAGDDGVSRHFHSETARVAAGVAALRDRDGAALGRLIDESHASLSKDFDCSTPEIDAFVAKVRAREGVLGVRLQGAGWGGSLVVLRRRDATVDPSRG